MKQDVYRVAYDEANAELTDILGKFEQLRLRKERIEKVVEVLKPLVGMDALATTEREQGSYSSSESFHAEQESPSYSAQQSNEPAAIPIPRRNDNAFGLGAAARDVREYSRLFKGEARGGH